MTIEDLEDERAELRKEEKRGRYRQDKLLKAMELIKEELEELKDNYNDFIDKELRPTVNKLKSINHNIKGKRQVGRKNNR